MSDGTSSGRGIQRDVLIAAVSGLVGCAVSLCFVGVLSVAMHVATKEAVDGATRDAERIAALRTEAAEQSREMNRLFNEAQANARLFESLAHSGRLEIARELSRNDVFIKKLRADSASAFVTELPAIMLREFGSNEVWPATLAVKSTGRPMLVCLQTAQWRGQGVLEDTTPVFLGMNAVSSNASDRRDINLYGRWFSFAEVSAGGASLSWLGTLPQGNWEIRVTWHQDRLLPSGEPVPEMKKVKTVGPSPLIAVELPVNFH